MIACVLTVVAAAAQVVGIPPAGAFNCSTGGGSHDILNGEGVIFSAGSGGTVTDSSETLNFGDGSSGVLTMGGSVTHYYETPGTYTVTFNEAGHINVTYSDGSVVNEPCSSQGVWGTVRVHELTPFMVYSAGGVDGRRVTFNASGSRDPAIITNYTWQFGDGQSATGLQVAHTYRNAKSYRVRLIIRSSFGNASTTSTIRLVTPRDVPDATAAQALGKINWNGQLPSFNEAAVPPVVPLAVVVDLYGWVHENIIQPSQAIAMGAKLEQSLHDQLETIRRSHADQETVPVEVTVTCNYEWGCNVVAYEQGEDQLRPGLPRGGSQGLIQQNADSGGLWVGQDTVVVEVTGTKGGDQWTCPANETCIGAKYR